MLTKLLHHLGLALLALAAVVMSLGVPSAADASGRHLEWAHGTVYVENHTGSRWPVRRAAASLDNHSGLHLIVVRRCPAGAQCIKVYEVGNLPGRTVGRARTTWNTATGELFTATVYLERRYGVQRGYDRRLGLVCHELGHAVGLQHTSSRSSCMFPYADSASDHLNGAGYRQLRTRYGR